MVLIYIYMGVSLYWPLYVLCVFMCACVWCVCMSVCVFDIRSEYRHKKHVMCQTSVTLLQSPSDTKVSRLDMCISVILLSKITHQKWRDHPLSQRNKTTKGAMGVEVGGDG